MVWITEYEEVLVFLGVLMVLCGLKIVLIFQRHILKYLKWICFKKKNQEGNGENTNEGKIGFELTTVEAGLHYTLILYTFKIFHQKKLSI